MKKTVLREYAKLIAKAGANVQKGQEARKGEFSRGSFQCGKNVLNYRKIKAMEAFL